MKKIDVIIVGAGISGLSCALMCHQNGLTYKIIEKSNRIGGRVGSISENGYIFDIGFQVYNTGYEIANSILDTDELDLYKFKPGAAIHDGNNFKIISDPLRDFSKIVSTIRSQLLNISDKVKIFSLKMALSKYSISKDQSKDKSTIDFLREYGFSNSAINNFFKPFFSGIFLEKDLDTSSKFFKFVFSKFSAGYAAVPYQGMQAIPDQIYNKLDPDSIIFNRELVQVKENNSLRLDDDTILEAVKVVFTGDSYKIVVKNHSIDYNSSTTIYFSSEIAPQMGSYIHLFPNDELINNISILTSICKNYSSKPHHLYSVTVLNNEPDHSKLISNIKRGLIKYYGGKESDYNFLKKFNLKKATTKQGVGFFDNKNFISGDYRFAGDQYTNGSIEGAVESGIITAKEILNVNL